MDQGLRKHHRRGCTVTGSCCGPLRGLTDHLHGKILRRIVQYDGPGDGNTVFCDVNSVCELVRLDQYGLATGSEGGFYGIGDDVNTRHQLCTGVSPKFDLFNDHI